MPSGYLVAHVHISSTKWDSVGQKQRNKLYSLEGDIMENPGYNWGIRSGYDQETLYTCVKFSMNKQKQF